jgi:hypothetical protein
MGLKQGLATLEIITETISGTTIQTDNVISQTISGTTINSTNVITPQLTGFGISSSGASLAAAAGSSTTMQIRAGISRIASGTSGWITYPAPFSAATLAITCIPAFVLPHVETPAFEAAGSISAGSVWLRTSGTQAGSIMYIAIGV